MTLHNEQCTKVNSYKDKESNKGIILEMEIMILFAKIRLKPSVFRMIQFLKYSYE